jgi:L-lactate dehydrogenase (cytochrome)
VPRSVFDYVDGAAEAELSIARSRDAFARVEFRPDVLNDVSTIDLSTTILGRPSTLPLVFAPTGFTRMMHHEGETAVARAAAAAGIPYALSTMGTTSPEAVHAAAPDAEHWFQLYLWRDRAASTTLIERAAASGFGALVLTVDTPVAGARMRDVRNGLTIPPTLTARTFIEMSLHPSWWFNLLTTEPLVFASLTSSDGSLAGMVDRVFDPSVTIADLEWLRGLWRGPIVVKGVGTAEAARMVVSAGANAVVLSNHGGRQLDRAATPLEELAATLDAVGDEAEVYLDGGVTSGADVVASVALGARAVLVGRAYLYGLMAGGEQGVRRAASVLESEMRRTMQLLGAKNIASLRRGSVRLRD